MLRGHTATHIRFDRKGTLMNFYTFGPVAAVLDAAYSGVTALAALFSPFAGAASAAIAIVVLTLVVRSALIPVGISQVRAEFTRRRLAPGIAELQKRHKKNPQLLAEKMSELYRVEKASPFAGMLPTLLQAPVLSIVYGLFIQASIGGQANALLSEHLFGVPLGTSLMTLLGSGAAWPGVLVYVVLLGVIACVAVLSRRAAVRIAASGVAVPMSPGMEAANRILSWLPLITVVFAAFVPLAATLYLTVTTSWTLVERHVLRVRLASARAVAPPRPARA
ncbi:MAG: YidC/Oxa1 family rane protein insertase [Actinomycetota bacterium]|nr:YidC/Oxa1 family rane protein insertase [Actinomycetota bacterium]